MMMVANILFIIIMLAERTLTCVFHCGHLRDLVVVVVVFLNQSNRPTEGKEKKGKQQQMMTFTYPSINFNNNKNVIIEQKKNLARESVKHNYYLKATTANKFKCFAFMCVGQLSLVNHWRTITRMLALCLFNGIEFSCFYNN